MAPRAALFTARSHGDKASFSPQDSKNSPSLSSTEASGTGKWKREDQGNWEKERAQDQRKRNAMYSKRNYYRKRQEFDTIQTQAYLLEEQNFNLRKENKRLEELLASAREKAAIREELERNVASGGTHSPSIDSGLSTASMAAAPPAAAATNPMHDLLASSLLGQSIVDPHRMLLQQMIHSVSPSPPTPNLQADLRLVAQNYATQQALSALSTSAARAPGPFELRATRHQSSFVRGPKFISPNALNEAFNLSQLHALQQRVAQPSTSLRAVQIGNRAAGEAAPTTEAELVAYLLLQNRFNPPL